MARRCPSRAVHESHFQEHARRQRQLVDAAADALAALLPATGGREVHGTRRATICVMPHHITRHDITPVHIMSSHI